MIVHFLVIFRKLNLITMRNALKLFSIFVILLAGCKGTNEVNINLKYDQNISLEYHEVIDAYQQLADAYPEAKLTEVGTTDIGKPLHIFMMSKDGDFDPSSIRKKGRTIIFINNGSFPETKQAGYCSILGTSCFSFAYKKKT